MCCGSFACWRVRYLVLFCLVAVGGFAWCLMIAGCYSESCCGFGLLMIDRFGVCGSLRFVWLGWWLFDFVFGLVFGFGFAVCLDSGFVVLWWV